MARRKQHMTEIQFRGLGQGDVVRGISSGKAYVVMEHHGDLVVAIRTQSITNPFEWELVLKADMISPDE